MVKNIQIVNRSHQTDLKRKDRAIARVTENIKNTRRKAGSNTRNLQSEIKDEDRKLQRANKKKEKLCVENKKLSAANSRLKKSLGMRNETIRIILDQKKELSFQLQLLFTEIEDNTVSIGIEKDHRNRKVWTIVVIKIIIEMIDNSVPSSAIANNLESTCRLLCPNVKILELPSVD